MSNELLWEIGAVIFYFIILTMIGVLSFRKQRSNADFLLGGRGLNFWMTALAAHASDMSSWLFMAYPAVIFSQGLINAWAAIGLLIFMYLNWVLVAPRIRVATEQYNSLTFSSYFESRFADTSGWLRAITGIMAIVFYTVYISAGLVGLGTLLHTLFGISFFWGISIGILIVIPYVFVGGYTTLAWIDFFQGIFLMCVIFFVPLYVMHLLGGWNSVHNALIDRHLPVSLIPNYSPLALINILFIAVGWGLGYFGQPHIVTKFMGIRNVSEMPKSKWVGMTWMLIALSAATFVGLVGIAFFQGKGLGNAQEVFILMVRETFHPFLAGLFLCAILATTINSMSSQVLIISSNLAEDFYKRFFRKHASQTELLLVSRLGIVLVALLAFLIVLGDFSSIYGLVLYAWSGLGASFGPLILLSLFSRKVNRFGAWAGVLVGGIVAALWPLFNDRFIGSALDILPIIPGFTLSFVMILLVSSLTQHKVTTYAKGSL